MGSRTGELPVSEGSIFWKYECSASETANAKPTLLFLHAGVADHTQWDTQAAFFLAAGWNTLRSDRFGFGRSQPSPAWLASSPARPPADHTQHVLSLIDAVLPPNSQVIPIGLSMGGALALQFAVSHPDRVAGLAVLAGGVPGFEYPNTAAEDALFEEADALIRSDQPEKAGRLQVRIWADGPLQPVGRAAEPVRTRMLAWCVDIARRECAGTGGGALEARPGEPVVLGCLDVIKVPTAVAWGTFDETYTSEAMRLVGSKVKGARVREFATAHMINLEMPDETNHWLNAWLEEHFGT